MGVMEEPQPGEQPEYAMHAEGCGQLVVRQPGEEQWRHVSEADAAFCAMVFPHLYNTPEDPE